MTENELKKLGLSDDAVKAVLNDQTNNFIEKTKFTELETTKKNLDKQIIERDKQLKTLQDSVGDNKDLKDKLEKLQQDNENQKKNFEGQILTMKIDNAVSSALTTARAKDARAVKAMLGLEKYELDSYGKVKGLDDAIAAAKKNSPWAFDAEENKDTGKKTFSGFKAGESGDTSGKDSGSTGDENIFWKALNGQF